MNIELIEKTAEAKGIEKGIVKGSISTAKNFILNSFSPETPKNTVIQEVTRILGISPDLATEAYNLSLNK